MTLDEIIQNRRSIRKFKPAPVPRELIEKCIEAARLAPSACNSQPCRYVVLDDEKTKNEFCESVFTGLYGTCKHIGLNAPALIAVCAKAGGNLETGVGQMISGTKYYLIDQGIAAEHLVLKAWESGLGSCWIGWFDPKKAKKFLKLPFGVKCEILIALGYPDESPAPRSRKGLKDVLSYNEY